MTPTSLAYAPQSGNRANTHPTTAPAPRESIYNAPDFYAPGTGRTRTKTETLIDDGYVKITQQAKWDIYAQPPKIERVTLTLETGNAADTLHVGNNPDGSLQVQINGKSYRFDAKGKNGEPIELHIKTNGGHDHLTISPTVDNPVTFEGGDGNDTFIAGAGRTRALGGAGDDKLWLGSGTGYAEGNDGDDLIVGGTGNAVIYGGNGKDHLYAGIGPADKQSYVDGGSGDDHLYAGSGHSVLHGGKGDDHLLGTDRTTFYTGKGRDRIWNNRPGDLIYAKAGDAYDRSQGSKFVEVKPSFAGNDGFEVSGDAEFKQRVDDDFEFLRSSPNGQKILADMDKEAPKAGAKVTIQKATVANSYSFRSFELGRLPSEQFKKIDLDDPRYGRVIGNKPGSRADAGAVNYDPMDTGDERFFTPPVVNLVHEIGHAYNGATGTNLPGYTLDRSASDPAITDYIHNTEFQVVGLPGSTAQPFDFDNDPSTPPTTINPEHFTENGMHREMGRPLRKSYLV
ncbi:M91 family zinc metallopeptidase [Pseudomonas sp. FP2338]|uniref:M91 family zinc metallopeptidase n=1 Tax=Pseudomonas sp. FP2338 TaxID=2954093 RepID=UPI0027340AAE|nr:M91 family zinc metallopeptidase [Pseudomonas sp. FP2338]WLH82168.1 M91 family zinc metallopeptidase [Pseudomonas sp. FP2338]